MDNGPVERGGGQRLIQNQSRSGLVTPTATLLFKRQMKDGLIAPAKYGNAAASTCQQSPEDWKGLSTADKYLSPTQRKQQRRHLAQICGNHTLFTHESTAESHADEIRGSIFILRV